MDNREIDVLLIEDNPHDAEMTKRALRKNNVVNHLVHLSDGAAALDFFFDASDQVREPLQKPKVVLLDLKMPKVNGLEVLMRIKSCEQTREIPVVVLTSSKESPDISSCYQLGVNSYIVKPVEFESFMKVVNDLGIYWLFMNEIDQ